MYTLPENTDADLEYVQHDFSSYNHSYLGMFYLPNKTKLRGTHMSIFLFISHIKNSPLLF